MTTFTAEPQHYPLPPRQDSRFAKSRLQIESDVAALQHEIDGFGLPAACARVLKDAVRDGLHFLIGTTDNDGGESVLLYAGLACPPGRFDRMWFDHYQKAEDRVRDAYTPVREDSHPAYSDRQIEQLHRADRDAQMLSKQFDQLAADRGCAIELEDSFYAYLTSHIGPAQDSFGLKGYSRLPLTLAAYLASGCPADPARNFWPKVESAALQIDQLGSK